MSAKTVVIIQGDHNDADYVTSECDITDDPKTLEVIHKVVNAMKNYKKKNPHSHNWESYGEPDIYEKYKDVLTEDEIQWFSDLVPYAPDPGEIHTIESVRIVKIESDEELM